MKVVSALFQEDQMELNGDRRLFESGDLKAFEDLVEKMSPESRARRFKTWLLT